VRREGTWQSDQRNGSCIIEMQFQYRYVGLLRLSVGSGDHRESRPSKKKLDAMEITERPRMQHAIAYARGSQNIAKDRVKLSEILLNGSTVNGGEGTREKNGFRRRIRCNCNWTTYIEPTVSPTCIKNWRMTFVSLGVPTFCRIKRGRKIGSLFCGTTIIENSNRFKNNMT